MTEPPQITLLPAEPFAGNTVSIKFTQAGSMSWVGEANCKHGITRNTTYLISPGQPPLNHAQMVAETFRQHDLIVGCDCPYDAPKLSAQVAYAAQTGVQPGERRIILEQSATIQPPGKDFVYYGRLVCQSPGAYYVEAIVKLGRSVAAGARGLGQVFISGTPAMISSPMVDVAGVATATVTGTLNFAVNQPIAVAYLNTGTSAESVPTTTLKVSAAWVP